MKRINLLLCTMLFVLCFSACSNNMAENIDNGANLKSVYEEPPQDSVAALQSLPESVPIDEHLLEPIETEKAETESQISRIDNDFFSFEYDSSKLEILDNTNTQLSDSCFYLMKNIEGDPMTSIAHVDLFGSTKIALPSTFTKDSWENMAEQIIANYYDNDFHELEMAAYDTQFSMEEPQTATTTISVRAVKDVPEINARVCLQNGITKSVILVIVTYKNDTADMDAIKDSLSTLKIK